MNKQPFKINYIFAGLWIAALGLVSFNFFYVFPLFDNTLLAYVENDAMQVAAHIQHLCGNCLDGGQVATAEIQQTLTDFDLKQVTIFTDSGQVVYSSASPPSGDRDTLPAKELMDRIRLGKKTSRIQEVPSTVGVNAPATFIAQVMVPIMEGNRFRGAYAIDRDISFYRGHLQTIKLIATAMLLAATGGALFLLWPLVHKAASTEKQLRHAHDQLSTAIDAIPDTFLVIDRNYNIVMANKAVRQVAGCNPVSRGLCCHQVSHHQDVPCTGHDDPCPLPLVLKHKRPINVLHTHYTVSGEPRWVDITASPIFDENGEVIQMIEACKDITRQKEAEQQLIQSKAELQETNRHLEEAIARANKLAIEADRANIAKSEFLANMSHEIRTPMNGVIGMTDLLLGTNPTVEQRDYLTTVRSSANSLLTIINDILDFSKIEAGKLVLESVDFDPRTLVEECGDLLAIGAQKKGVEFVCHIDSQVPALVRGDLGRLRQVITNLTSNAIKFTNHGEVVIRVKRREATAETTTLLFEITDTGIGIEPQQIPALFKPFVQADASTTRSYGGTGLGLSICKQLVELMGGEIGVRSRKGGGSYFWFTARLAAPMAGTEASTPLPGERLDGMRVLVVDDNSRCRQWLRLLLEEVSCQIDEAASGPEAIISLRQAKAAGRPFTVALLDADLVPTDSGILTRQIQADASCGSPQLIVMTPLGRPLTDEYWREVGASAHLDKPVKRQPLFTTLAAVQRGESGFVARPAVDEEDPFATLTAALRPHAKVLLAEDNLTNQKVAFGLLRKFGIEPVVVQNGQEAVQAVQQDAYDLVFMDCQMPIMDGLTATARIREMEDEGTRQRLPIVAMTAHALTGDREKCLQAGMDDYLSKPLSVKALAAALCKWLGTDGATLAGRDLPSQLPTEEKGPTLLDYQDLLSRLMDDAELAREVLAVFLDDMPERIVALKAAVASGDPKQIKDCGHSVKGAARNISAVIFQETAWQIEQAGRDSDARQAEALLPTLDAQYQDLAAAIRERIA